MPLKVIIMFYVSKFNDKQNSKNIINNETNNYMILNKDYLNDNSHPINNIFENNNINYSNDGQH